MKQKVRRLRQAWKNRQHGKIGYILLWLFGVPIPILLLFFVPRGCS